MTLVSGNKIPIAIVGSSSMVGSRFCELFKRKAHLLKADLEGKVTVDITRKDSVNTFFKNYNFDWVFLFSAFTDVDAAEKQRGDKNGSCWRINVVGTQNVVEACKMFKKNFLFISTDFVFDGEKGPYSENASLGPDLNKVSWYGITKIEGEKLVRQLETFLIIRISYPYRAGYKKKDDLAKRILRLYKQGQLYPMFSDQIITPTFIDDLAIAVDFLLEKGQKGVFHIASPKATSHYKFARRLIKKFGGNPVDIKKGSIHQFLSRYKSTPRPVKGGLKVDRIKRIGFEPTDWQEGIELIFIQSAGKLI